jgi:hypothetical protein
MHTFVALSPAYELIIDIGGQLVELLDRKPGEFLARS